MHTVHCVSKNKKLSCRRETSRRFLSLNILLSHSRSFETTLLSRTCVIRYQYSIETMSVYRTVSEIFSVKNDVTLKPEQESFKVIENGAVRQIIYDFLLVRHCKYSSYLLAFLSYLTLNNIVTLKSGLQITEGHPNWYHSKAWCLFPIRLLQ